MAARLAVARVARAYSTKVSALPFEDLKVAKLANGVTIASQETFSPLATIAVVVNAGSRHETAATAGAAAYLKATAFQSSQDYSAFALTRETEAIGAKLSVHATRESIAYVISTPRSHQDAAIKLLASAATKPLFHPWEIREQDERVEEVAKAAKSCATGSLIDAAHQLAFRQNLGRSNVIPCHKIGHVCSGSLKSFYADRFVGSEVNVVATGVSHASAVEALTNAFSHVAPKTASTAPSKFYGGGQESRTVTGCDYAHAVIAFNAGESHVNGHLLSLILGNSTAVLHGSSASKVGAALAKLGVDASASSFANTYSDAGLFGVLIKSDAAAAAAAVNAAVAAIKHTFATGVTEAELARAKNQLSLQLLSATALQRTVITGTRLAQKHSTLLTAEALAEAVQAVTLDSINASVKAIAGSKAVYAASGNIDNVPYLDQLAL